MAAVEQGRIIYANIRKFVFYLLSCNLAEIVVIFLAILVTFMITFRSLMAVPMLNKVLEADPMHEGAAVSLATILLGNGDIEAALAVLEPLPSTPEVDRIRAAARLSTSDTGSTDELAAKLAEDPDNDGVRVDLARSLVASRDFAASITSSRLSGVEVI